MNNAQFITLVWCTNFVIRPSDLTQVMILSFAVLLSCLAICFSFQKFMNMFKETHSQASLPMMPPPELGPMLSEMFDIEEHPRWLGSSASSLFALLSHATSGFCSPKAVFFSSCKFSVFKQKICEILFSCQNFAFPHGKVFSPWKICVGMNC